MIDDWMDQETVDILLRHKSPEAISREELWDQAEPLLVAMVETFSRTAPVSETEQIIRQFIFDVEARL